jgi:hypothetical protein
MAGPHNNDQRHEVHCSEAVASKLYQLQQKAPASQRELITIAFRSIVEKLQVDPNQLGEPLYRLPGLRMQVRTVAVAPLSITFAVCEDRPLVFIKTCNLLPSP